MFDKIGNLSNKEYTSTSKAAVTICPSPGPKPIRGTPGLFIHLEFNPVDPPVKKVQQLFDDLMLNPDDGPEEGVTTTVTTDIPKLGPYTANTCTSMAATTRCRDRG
jgi:hypothetical protein